MQEHVASGCRPPYLPVIIDIKHLVADYYYNGATDSMVSMIEPFDFDKLVITTAQALEGIQTDSTLVN